MLYKQAVHTNTVNSEAQHSQFDFHFRFLLLHILAQGEKIGTISTNPSSISHQAFMDHLHTHQSRNTKQAYAHVQQTEEHCS